VTLLNYLICSGTWGVFQSFCVGIDMGCLLSSLGVFTAVWAPISLTAKFTGRDGLLWCPIVWLNTCLEVAVKVFFRCDYHIFRLWLSLMSYNVGETLGKGLKNTDSFPQLPQWILPPICNIKTLPEFQAFKLKTTSPLVWSFVLLIGLSKVRFVGPTIVWASKSVCMTLIGFW
jgi:hypothetical protein